MAYDAQGNWTTDFGGMSQWGGGQMGTGQLGTSLSGLNQSAPNNQLGLSASRGLGLDASGTTAGQGGGWFSNAFGGTDAGGNQTSGWVSPTFGALGGLAQSWLGFQGLGQAQDQLSFQKNAWQEQFNIQKEEYEYQKQRRQDRVDNYNASLNRDPAASPTNV